MIHYHGTPITPNNVGYEAMKCRHVFISFAANQQTRIAAEIAQSFAFDNGAYTTWKQGKKYDFDSYASWVEKWHKHPGFDWCLIPDVIDGQEHDNKLLLGEWSKIFPASFSVPVWHLHESLPYLLFLCRQYPRVAIGSSGEYATVGKAKWWNRMAEAMNSICDDQGRPQCKLHGLRMLDPAIYTKFPFASADSTNIARNHGDNKRWESTRYELPNNELRARILAERIEAYNSAPTWQKRATQISLLNLEHGRKVPELDTLSRR